MVGKRTGAPPLGLLTVAAMFPEHWDLKVVDMNVEPLTDEHLDWADGVFTSTMIVQQHSLREVIARCNERKVPVVAGGPYPTSFHDEIAGVDHFVLDEVEESFPRFLELFEAGTAPHVFRTPTRPDIANAPLPRFDLIDLSLYGTMALQFSRGCPFTCEFCDIPTLYGRATRTKSNEQMLAELEVLHDLGWRGALFLVDDNFIGNKRNAQRLLPALAEWQEERRFPFVLVTEASVNMVEMEPLLDGMVDARFGMVFLGIESPNPEALKKTKKGQNLKAGVDEYLLGAVRTIQSKGIEVTAGFILGLDGDGPDVFDAQLAFIQEAGIPMAMVGLLSVLRGTALHDRMEREGRLIKERPTENRHIELNYVPELGRETVIAGYKRVLGTLYEPTLSSYFERCWRLLENLEPAGSRLPERRGRPEAGGGAAAARTRPGLLSARGLGALRWRMRRRRRALAILGRSVRRQAFSRQGPAYLRFMAKTILHKRDMFPRALRMAMQGYHFQKVASQIVAEQVVAAGDYGYSVTGPHAEVPSGGEAA
jgi:radical SAM superfamily enzyme YgiQ (UPF0313 family)